MEGAGGTQGSRVTRKHVLAATVSLAVAVIVVVAVVVSVHLYTAASVQVLKVIHTQGNLRAPVCLPVHLCSRSFLAGTMNYKYITAGGLCAPQDSLAAMGESTFKEKREKRAYL